MEKKDLCIVFMGTPDFAVESLKGLVENNFNIVGVITAPDKQAGRGLQLQQSAVKHYALVKGLNILQPEKLKNSEFLISLKNLNANLQIVVAFRMLPEVVWNMPEYGTINVHASLLPNYRGAAPINWAIMNGEKETGVTTFKLHQEIDTGNILLQEKINITDEDDASIIHDKLKILGANLLIKTIDKLINNSLQEKDQSILINEKNGSDLKHAPKIHTETCKINWDNKTTSIYNLIRGLSPHPSAFTLLDNKILKIFKSEIEIVNHQNKIGDFITDNKTFLKFCTIDGYILCKEVQLQGKKRMAISDFLRGFNLK